MGAFKTTVAVLIGAAFFGLLGTLDYASALTDEAIEKEQRPLRIAQESILPLTHPIAYKAVVCQSGPEPLQKPRCRFYTGAKIK